MAKVIYFFEIKKILPNIEIVGFDISSYAIKKLKKRNKEVFIYQGCCEQNLILKKYFDLTFSLGVFHNLELFEIENSLKELNKVSKKSYIMVESYDQELFNLQCWHLHVKVFFF